MRRAALALLVAGVAFATTAAAKTAPLPNSFLWGVSSSGFQSEGGVLDDNWQRYIATHPTFDPYKASVDFRHRFRGDVALAAGLGVNTYRIGINWARVVPARGRVDESALRYYDQVIAAMRARGIAPLLTLDHWDYPGWVYDQGSWANPQTVTDFLAFVRLIADRYHAQVHRWLTFNEGYFYKVAEGFYRPLDDAGAQAMNTNLIAAHRGAYDLLHARDPEAEVSSNVFWRGATTFADDRFLDGIRDKLDYIGLDYYYPGYRASDVSHTLLGTAWEAQLDPFGMFTALRTAHRAFPKLPILITEAGMPTENGKRRPDGYTRAQSLRDTVFWVQRARSAGVPVIGYLYWSLTDNYEFGSYTSRFGLYTVDALTDPSLRRRPTDAVPAFRAAVRARGVRDGYRLVRRPARADCAQVAAADRSACVAATRNRTA